MSSNYKKAQISRMIWYWAVLEAASYNSPSPTWSEGGTLSEPCHPSFFSILDLEDSEKRGVTLRTHSFLLENLKKVLTNHNFWKKIENLYSLMVLAKYYWTGYIFTANESSFSIEFKYTFIIFLKQWKISYILQK